MGRLVMQRNFKETEITFTRFSIVSGKLTQTDPETLTVNGNIDEAGALKRIPLNGANGVAIIGLNTVDNLYEMEIETFKKYATKIDNTEK